MSYDNVLAYINQLALSIINTFNTTLAAGLQNGNNPYEIIHQLYQLETLDEMQVAFLDFCDRISETLQENRSDKNIEIIQKIKEYVHNNYHDPNLSLDIISDKVQLSPGYLGRLFKKITNSSFNDYLNTIRLAKASQLLISTNDPASKICRKVGIYNYTYFFTLFKKEYGLTPSQYRKSQQLSINDEASEDLITE